MKDEERLEMVVKLATGVMGWQVQRRGTGNLMAILPDGSRLCIERVNSAGPARMWNPVGEIADAWMIVEKFRHGHNALGKDAVACVIELTVYDALGEDCGCKIYSPAMMGTEAIAETMPLAICRAALKAIEG